MHEKSTRLAGENKGGRVTSNFYLERTAVLCKKVRYYNFCVCASSVLGGTAVLCKKLDITIFWVCSTIVLGAVCCFAVSDNVTFYSVSPAMLYYLLTFRILQRCSRRKNNISISQG